MGGEWLEGLRWVGQTEGESKLRGARSTSAAGRIKVEWNVACLRSCRELNSSQGMVQGGSSKRKGT